MIAEQIRVRGLVQGVGFRPFIWRLAAEHGVSGDVRNDGEGVLIHAVGDGLDAFCTAISEEAPPLSRVESVERSPLAEAAGVQGFSIVETHQGSARTGVTPDAATCQACIDEITDPSERRYRYAFTNCTHCGPRFSIVESIPYDRAATVMRAFEMCPACRAEYENPADRRFHAQPIACPDCGPRLWLEIEGRETDCDPIEEAVERLRAGKIIALKGIGGFHLACDAANDAAVTTLRDRKRRPDKPFALMAPGIGSIERHCDVTNAEKKLLADPAAPIVLIEQTGAANGLAPSLAPELSVLGWMLPYTPLHHLLLTAFGAPLVMTSGNLSGEPQAIDNGEARQKLSAFCDAFLMHDRPIARRLDDSVARIVAGEIRVLRRARGFAPAPLDLPPELKEAPPVTACGGELKSAICLTRDGKALLSHHLGDLEDLLSYTEFEKAAADYAELFEHRPEVFAADLHPNYRSTQFAEKAAERLGVPLVRVQHHHAHVASTMAESGWPVDAPVLGVALDGLGYGDDGTIWGGEFLLATYRDYRRVACLKPVPLPGGDAANREPWRNLVSQLKDAGIWSDALAQLNGHPLRENIDAKPVDMLKMMMKRGVNAPLTSSAGRLFDAVGAAIGCAFDRITHEGQAAMEAESLARHSDDLGAYSFAVTNAGELQHLDAGPMWSELVGDLAEGAEVSAISTRFHRGFAHAVSDLAADLANREKAGAIALSGGVMQNSLLLALIVERLGNCGLPVLTQREVPSNDGGLAFGQAAIAAARLVPSRGVASS